ncbi:hypothetical protein H9660_10165 [Clostridium sp. Sa3CUN1]|uniref:PepSY domain-containing protein n=1 Tax=Clostridium gallinarum TaxID=2762246 RepID=A0ABR8Q513_9CLOT|nr:hypothetical protein [Clostridium gallinarum]MBD7915511.1 hypothetical protein [Clostridium gallinarum]
MRTKKLSIIFSLIIIVLLFFISVIVINILNIGKKEVKVARKFIEELSENSIIKENNDLEKEIIKEEILNKKSNRNSKIKYSVIVGKYAVDIDKDYNILGFSNKNINEVSLKSNEISEDDAIYLAKSYLVKITQEDFKFKEIRNQEGIDSSVYNVIFYKYREGYPYYYQEINTLINKNTGELEGYSNYPVTDVNYIDDINITEKEANNIIKENFKMLKLDIIITEEPILCYVNISDKEMVLAYVFNIGINSENNKDNCISLVRADTGEIINYNLEAVAIE